MSATEITQCPRCGGLMAAGGTFAGRPCECSLAEPAGSALPPDTGDDSLYNVRRLRAEIRTLRSIIHRCKRAFFTDGQTDGACAAAMLRILSEVETDAGDTTPNMKGQP